MSPFVIFKVTEAKCFFRESVTKMLGSLLTCLCQGWCLGAPRGLLVCAVCTHPCSDILCLALG